MPAFNRGLSPMLFSYLHVVLSDVSVTQKVFMLNKAVLCLIRGNLCNLWTTAFSRLKG